MRRTGETWQVEGNDRELFILVVSKFIKRGRDDDIMFIENVESIAAMYTFLASFS